MRKKRLKLTSEQKARGVIFSSHLVGGDITHEVKASDSNKWEKIERLKDDKFFNDSPFTANEIRS